MTGLGLERLIPLSTYWLDLIVMYLLALAIHAAIDLYMRLLKFTEVFTKCLHTSKLQSRGLHLSHVHVSDKFMIIIAMMQSKVQTMYTAHQVQFLQLIRSASEDLNNRKPFFGNIWAAVAKAVLAIV